MASPRVFISSTYYDLKSVRSDLERFVEAMGFEPVLNEKGHVPYGSDKRLEDFCYREVGACDIIVSIIGGRYGNSSAREDASISQVELKTAIELGKQVYVFVDRSVKVEHRFVQKNKDISNLQYTSVDNKKVFEYLDYVEQLPLNNATFGFDVANDIIEILREQWAGLFKSFLQDNAKKSENQYINEIKDTAQTLKQMVTYLAEDKKNTHSAIQTILSVNHPIFSKLKKIMGVKYRIYFSKHEEMLEWLKVSQYHSISPEFWDSNDFEEFVNNEDKKEQRLLKVRVELFGGNGDLKLYTVEQWNDSWIALEKRKKPIKDDDEPPF